MQLHDSEICQFTKSAYGLVDAPFLWYKELQKHLSSLGFEESPFDPCVFVLRDSKGNPQGVLGLHVDDGLCGGNEVFEEKVILFFFCCIAELAIKPCRSSRSKLRGEFGIPKHLQNRKQKHDHNTKQKEHGKCLECETRGEKRVKRPKRPNALICRTPGGSIRYPLSSSLGMMLISHSIVSIPASPSRFAI